jgi:hypothetical protein
MACSLSSRSALYEVVVTDTHKDTTDKENSGVQRSSLSEQGKDTPRHQRQDYNFQHML